MGIPLRRRCDKIAKQIQSDPRKEKLCKFLVNGREAGSARMKVYLSVYLRTNIKRASIWHVFVIGLPLVLSLYSNRRNR